VTDLKPEDFACAPQGEPTDARDTLANMARSIDNMAILMTQLHETEGRRGAAVSYVRNDNGPTFFVTATNDVDEKQIAVLVIKGFHEVLFAAHLRADMDKRIKELEAELAALKATP
jgi:hypothetical protein